MGWDDVVVNPRIILIKFHINCSRSYMPFTEGKDFTYIPTIRLRGRVVHGFKRGSTQLGFPTANLEHDAFKHIMKDYKEGVYIGWAQVLPHIEADSKGQSSGTINPLHPNDMGIKKTMLSLGKNVQFDAEQATLEAYIHHKFANDFYDHDIEIVICAYIREQMSFDSLESLIATIEHDVEIGEWALDHDEQLKQLHTDPFFTSVKTASQPELPQNTASLLTTSETVLIAQDEDIDHQPPQQES